MYGMILKLGMIILIGLINRRIRMKRIYLIMALLVVAFGLIGVETLENGSTFGVIRGQINDNFTEVADTDTLQTARIDTLFTTVDSLAVDALYNKAEIDTINTRLKDASLFAVLTGGKQTLTDTAYAYVDSDFDNYEIENFSLKSGSLGNHIQYDGDETITVLITGHFNLEVANACDIYFALKIGSGGGLYLIDRSVITRTVKTNNDVVAMSGVYMGEISKGDKIQIVVATSRDLGTEIYSLNMSVALVRVK